MNEPFSNQPINTQQEYIPFNNDYQMGSHKVNKCEYCGANMRANCHAHASYCPYSCNYEPPVDDNLPVGNGFFAFGLFLVIYCVWKFKMK